METGDLCELRVLGRGTESGFSECQTDVYSGSILSAAQVCRSFDEYQSGSHQPGLSGLQTLAQTAVNVKIFHNSLYQFQAELFNNTAGAAMSPFQKGKPVPSRKNADFSAIRIRPLRRFAPGMRFVSTVQRFLVYATTLSRSKIH